MRGRWRCGSELKRERKGGEVFNKIEMGVQKKQKEDDREKLGDLMIERERDNVNYERAIRERERESRVRRSEGKNARKRV